MEERANTFARYGYRFVPLIGEPWTLAVRLDLIFLRRDDATGLVKSGGDIDNRIKVFFDGLRMPQNGTEIPKDRPAPGEDEDPFYCLMDDDKAITEIAISTDRLLRPQRDDEGVNDVVIVAEIETMVIDDGPFPLARLG